MVDKVIQALMDDTICLLSLDMKRLAEAGDIKRTQILYDDKLQSFLSNLIAVGDRGLMDHYVEVLKQVEKDATRSYIKEKSANNG
jgi:hypothetical protein